MLSAVGYSQNADTYLNEKNIRTILETIASPDMEGRETGQPGQKKAAEYIRGVFDHAGLKPVMGDSYFQHYPLQTTGRGQKKAHRKLKAENVIGLLEGAANKNQFIVISAHYDHLGKRDSLIYCGADDDGSGTTSVIALAQYFGEKAKRGVLPDVSLLFVLFSGEEKGLLGSSYFVKNPPVNIDSIVCDINIDMVGRTDSVHSTDSMYIYSIGSAMINPALAELVGKADSQCCNLHLDYKYDAPDEPNRFYYRSDHYNFAKKGIPVVFFFSGIHKDYHQPGDTADKIQYQLLQARLHLFSEVVTEACRRNSLLLTGPQRIK